MQNRTIFVITKMVIENEKKVEKKFYKTTKFSHDKNKNSKNKIAFFKTKKIIAEVASFFKLSKNIFSGIENLGNLIEIVL